MTKIGKLLGIGAGVAAVSILGAYAFAQHGPGHMGPGMGPGMMQGPGMMHGMRSGMMGNFGDPSARLTAVKAELGIKPEQSAAWDSYAKIVTDVATSMKTQRDNMDHDAIHKMEQKDREAFAASMQTQRQEAQAKVKAAAETLLAKLDEAQKTKAGQSLPGLVAAGPGAGPGMRGGMGGSMGRPHHGMSAPSVK